MTIGPRLEAEDEPLHRQVNPAWIHNGEPSSQTFKPTPKDEGLLSVALGSLQSAEEAFQHHTEVLGLLSVGVLDVTAKEVDGLELASYAAATDESPAHGVIDMRGLSRGPAATKAKLLLAAAMSRSWTHQASS